MILGSSIALVLSFWQQIAERPMLKFGLFNGVTAALFGIGLYIHRRWRLPTTTQGDLLIAVLLVPLNFLAIAAVTLKNPTSSPLVIGGELASIGLFALLTFLACRVLVDGRGRGDDGRRRRLRGLAAHRASVRRRRFQTVELAAMAWCRSGLTASTSCGEPARSRRTVKRATKRDANRLFKILGATLFAALLPLGVLLVKTAGLLATLARIAPTVALLGAPLVAAGLTLRRRLAIEESGGTPRRRHRAWPSPEPG